MNSAEILKDIIQSRRSIFPKDYTGNPISDEVLSDILQSADFAPNHKRTKPWRIKVFKGQEKNLLGIKLAEIYKKIVRPEVFLEKKYLDIPKKWEKSDAVAVIIINYSGLVPEWEEIAAVSMAVQNMYLTCTANNIGSYWGTPGMKDHLAEELNLEENQKCLGFFFMGNLV